jgi:hypothetical protein
MIWHEDGGWKIEDGLQIQQGAASVPSSILASPREQPPDRVKFLAQTASDS